MSRMPLSSACIPRSEYASVIAFQLFSEISLNVALLASWTFCWFFVNIFLAYCIWHVHYSTPLASMMRVRKEVFGEEAREISGGELPSGRHPGVADQAEATVREDLLEKLISASARKIGYFQGKTKEENEENVDDCYAVVQESMLNQLLSDLLCPTRKNPGISFCFDESSGFAVNGSILCSHCETTKKEYLYQRTGKSKSVTEGFDINARAVLAFRGIGCGLSAIRLLSPTNKGLLCSILCPSRN